MGLSFYCGRSARRTSGGEATAASLGHKTISDYTARLRDFQIGREIAGKDLGSGDDGGGFVRLGTLVAGAIDRRHYVIVSRSIRNGIVGIGQGVERPGQGRKARSGLIRFRAAFLKRLLFCAFECTLSS